MGSITDGSEDDIIVWGTGEESLEDLSEGNDSDQLVDLDKVGDLTPLEGSIEDAPEESDDYSNEDDNGENAEDSDVPVYVKKYYKISEVESLIGETQSTIRFWEDSFSELGKNFCSQRSRGGTRKFTKDNIDNLKLLKMLLRERRLTIEGAISEIKNDRRRNAKDKALVLLQETRDELNNLIDAYNCILHQKE